MRKSGWIGVGTLLLAGLILIAWGRGLRAESARNVAGETPRDDGAADLRPGTACTVYLRGDAGGVSFHDRIADLSLLIACRGTFEHEDAQWVQVRDGSRHFSIPRSSIAVIEFGDAKGGARDSEGPGRRSAPEGPGQPKLDLR